jgi:hypothetical protein
MELVYHESMEVSSMKWNKPEDVPIPKYEDLLFVYEDDTYDPDAGEFVLTRVWGAGSYFPTQEIVKLGHGIRLYPDEVLYWARPAIPPIESSYGPEDYPNPSELYDPD